MKIYAVIMTCLACASASEAALVRVGLYQKELPMRLCVSAKRGLRVTPSSGRSWDSTERSRVCFDKRGDAVEVAGGFGRGRATSFTVESLIENDPLTVATPLTPERHYVGTLTLRAGERELLTVNELSEDAYLASIVSEEMPASWPVEALKAQAVVARSYLRSHRHRHAKDGYDACDLTHCQVFKGKNVARSAEAAVLSTADEVVLDHGRVANAVYHSACGGRTAAATSLWPGARVAYLTAVTDARAGRAFCSASPEFTWQLQESLAMLSQILAEDPSSGALENLQIVQTDADGRVLRLKATCERATVSITGAELYERWGRTLGWHQLKSTWFTLESRGATFVFQGRGLGHGVGLCQWGAGGRAIAGEDYRQILRDYFPGTSLGQEKSTWLERFLNLFFLPDVLPRTVLNRQDPALD